MMSTAGFRSLPMSPKIKLQEGAIFISDAHYSNEYPAFFDFLKALDEGAIKTPQLILMGDMFELLFGPIKQTQRDNSKELELLNTLSKKIEIIYLEGNHDFGLKALFPDILVYPLSMQPAQAEFYDQQILLSHGDTKTPIGYQIYTKLIRNPFILFCIGIIDNLCLHCIITWLKNRGEKKNPCYKITAFKELIEKRLSDLSSEVVDVVIEGHFHQDVSFDLNGFYYTNLGAFACNQKYFIVQSSNKQFFLKECCFKEPG